MRQCDLDEFAGHPKESGHPHPKQGCGTAKVQSKSYAADVAGTHSARERGRKGLEVGGVALRPFLVKFSRGDTDRMPEVTNLREPEV